MTDLLSHTGDSCALELRCNIFHLRRAISRTAPILVLLFGCREVEEYRTPAGKVLVRSQYFNDDDGNRVPDGYYRGWYESGNKRIEGYYKNGKQTGEWRYWHETGTLWARSQYIDGVEVGVRTTWRADGTKLWEVDYGKGTRTPVYTCWHANGRKRWQGKGCVFRGKWEGEPGTWWDEEGREVSAPIHVMELLGEVDEAAPK